MDMGGRSPGAVAVGTPGAGVVPALAEALADEPRLRGELERVPWLAGVLARNDRLLDDARGESALWRAAVASEVLADALMPALSRKLTGPTALLDQDPQLAERFLGSSWLLEFAARGSVIADALRQLKRERAALLM
ncbi:hypothetical protein [Streptomyces sp. NBC_01176]|uniref:hypothetical protein n=1 Tax=Streptomyces sp. NBC_01176 TaxID=2903760 RepID=UPI00386C917F|nr:hypothetical protein OG199_44945 [Streptomyces sp. NBC_01176]